MNDSNLKHAEIGKIPRDWEVVRLGESISLEYGKGLTEAQRKSGRYPVFGSNGIVGCHNDFLTKGPGIVVGRKGTIGAINWSKDNFWPIDTTYFVKVIGNDVDLRWLYYKLNSLTLSKLNMATGTPGLNRDLVYTQIILLPILPEQKKIAEILSTVDQAIEKVDLAIEKTQKLKKGLMQELLTKGIGHKEFKETDIGRIPKAWKLMKLGETANVRYGLGQPPALKSKGIPMIRATNVKRGKIASEGLIFINPNAIPNSRDPFLRAGDILVVRSGAYTGDVALVTKEWEGAVAGYDLIVTPSDTIDSQFLTYYLLSSSVQKRHFVGLKVRSAQPHLNSSQVEETPIPLPPLSEQRKIAGILGTVDERLELLRKRKERLERVKKGLMNDLLTGRKRVKLN